MLKNIAHRGTLPPPHYYHSLGFPLGKYTRADKEFVLCLIANMDAILNTTKEECTV